MKFTTLVTILAASTSAFAFPYERRDVLSLTGDCGKVLKEQFSNCLISEKITLDNLENVCSTYKSEKCQNLIKSGIGKIDACSSQINTVIETFDKVISGKIASAIELKCAKDENGNVCPISNYVIQNGDIPQDPNDDKWKQAVEETCKSKACSEAFINYTDATTNTPVSQTVVSGILSEAGVQTPEVNTDVLKNTADTIKASQSDAAKTGDAATTGSTGDAATTGSTGDATTTGANDNDTTTSNAATTGATGANNTATTGASNTASNGNSVQGTANQANTSNDSNTSGAASLTFQGSLTMAIVFVLSTLLL